MASSSSSSCPSHTPQKGLYFEVLEYVVAHRSLWITKRKDEKDSVPGSKTPVPAPALPFECALAPGSPAATSPRETGQASYPRCHPHICRAIHAFSTPWGAHHRECRFARTQHHSYTSTLQAGFLGSAEQDLEQSSEPSPRSGTP